MGRFGKVTYVVTDLAYSGAEVQVRNLAIEFKRRSWDVEIVSMLKPIAFVAELSTAKIPVKTLNMRRGVPDPRAIYRLHRILSSSNPDVVHSHMIHANLLARVARLFGGMPVLISTAHSTIEGNRLMELAYRLTDPLADITTNVSLAAVERYVRAGVVPKEKIMFMPNGIDTSLFRYDPMLGLKIRESLALGGDFVWLAVGRFEEAKDYPTLLRAFRLVLERNEKTVLLLAGQGTLFEEMKKLAGDLSLDSYVRFLGLRQDIPELMNAADAYVMSSAWEGLPMVLLEAAASGLPSVVTDVGGNREVVLHEKSGYVVPPQDIGALADAMCRLMSLPQSIRLGMGRAARLHAERNYSVERIVDKWEALYLQLLNRKQL